ncbi:MAG: 6-bladed beta-propeller [Rhodothermaceae bacterium]|nr:6-bladed beta-propeller [Rhodothermaceae bacterium]MXX58680.1 6-bladed beta-propeller [Rhodothermaceae bacterium]MYD19319.1 6-bladed beta-propeller [Rhodothermaceae bacterium]MYD57576.1 6-bladed beta-propeller [Rhodothermaceae bacterium]MYI43143.1 6-bladed beta-propeller [Rhodothermaceae bacterium]
MNTNLALRRICATLAIGACMLAPAQAQELTFTLVEQFVIGDDEEASAEYLLSFPKMVRTDSKGNIYVQDRRRMDIRVFDATGQYVTTIGKRGEGPGEMRDLIGMHMDDQDRLIVADRISARFTIFTEMGNGIETSSFVDERTISPHPILSLEGAYVLKYVRLIDDPEEDLPYINDDNTLHLHDSKLNRIESFARLDELFDLNRPFLKADSDSPDALIMATNGIDTIILAPHIYSGYVYRYTRSNGSWDMEKLKGSPAPRRAYIPYSERDREANPDLRGAGMTISGPTGIYRARVLNWSVGMAILSTSEFVNFTKQTPLGGKVGNKAELFDQDGSLQGYGPLRFDSLELNSNRRVMGSISILWTDGNDRVYLRRRNEQGYYVLSVAELEISSK